MSDGSRTQKKWEKPLGIFFIALGYAILAAGIVLACLSIFSTKWRIISAVGAFFIYLIIGAVGILLTDISLSGFQLQRKREWAELSRGDRFIYIISYPCRLVLVVLNFFNP